MLSDGKLTDFVAVKPFDFDTATPDQRLLELARNLDAGQEWRDTVMEWDFEEINRPSDVCGTAGCAIGLARLLWPTQMICACGDRQFDLNGKEWAELFSVRFAKVRGIFVDAVTPGMVAAAIREFVSKRSAS